MSVLSPAAKSVEASPAAIDRLVRMAWHDRTSFEQIHSKTGLREAEVICLMRRNLKRRSFNLWRKRASGRVTKHRTLLKRRLAGDVDG